MERRLKPAATKAKMTYCGNPIRLQRVLEHLREVLELSRGRSRNDLEEDRRLGSNLVRLLEQLGAEAAGVSPDYRASYVAVPWLQLIELTELRNRSYETVDRDALWKIVSQDLPGLVPELESIILRLSAS
jgi:uncharacterized protein with HEPN domain